MALVDVIKYEVNSKELVGKFSSDKISLGSQLVVYPAQTAFFVKGGQVFDEFQSGTYTIRSENIPVLGKVFNIPFGSETPFQSEVWFVNQVSILDCKWGTTSPIQIEDPKYGVIVPIRAYGQYGFKVNNPRAFLERLIGNMPNFSVEKITAYFRGVILSKLTSIISNKLYSDNLSVININSHTESISEYAKSKLIDDFAEYGLDLELFNAIAITVDEDDSSFRRLKDTKDSLARINIMGKDNYQMERSFDVLDSAAGNEGGGLISAGVSLGAGVNVGSQIGSLFNQQLNLNPSTPPPLPSTQYFLGINGQQHGPFDIDAIRNAVNSHQIDCDTFIWKKGMSNWERIGNVSEFENLFNNCPPPLPN